MTAKKTEKIFVDLTVFKNMRNRESVENFLKKFKK